MLKEFVFCHLARMSHITSGSISVRSEDYFSYLPYLEADKQVFEKEEENDEVVVASRRALIT